ncbi:Uncharacterized protein TCM_006368 [Theobroma cacao]|uniref:Uncharacterized protein n=1 Tax=Theobroma cacao TaxID=3641 RepID=A0A061DY24_THECC|nr:Uncharacterized protein TCM_006368 [Theobroma cacao]
MEEIFRANLEGRHTRKLTFSCDGRTALSLPQDDRFYLIVEEDGSGRSWKFECQREQEANCFSFSGRQWTKFAKSSIEASITLFRKDDIYIIQVSRALFLSSFVVLAVYLADGSLSVCSGGRGLFPSSCFVLAAMLETRRRFYGTSPHLLAFLADDKAESLVPIWFFKLGLVEIKTT